MHACGIAGNALVRSVLCAVGMVQNVLGKQALYLAEASLV